jgi:hypothetical protein
MHQELADSVAQCQELCNLAAMTFSVGAFVPAIGTLVRQAVAT